MAKAKKTQPSKYDKYALEAEFLAGDSDNIAKFFKARKIPEKTGYRMAKGWPEKWKAVREKGLKTFQNKLARELAEQAETELAISKALLSVGTTALFPSEKAIAEGSKALKPATAGEAARILEIGNKIRRNVTDGMKEAVRIEFETTQGDKPPSAADEEIPTAGPAPVIVKIKLPSNGR